MSSQKPPSGKFKTSFTKKVIPTDPESLFRDLKLRDPQIKHLWSHQADILRAYDKKHLKTSDIALELPTGSGKTLIGLLLAEYRRGKFADRVIYLCPTRQLANQVCRQSVHYGIKTLLLLPPSYSNLNEYILSNAIGVTTYSGLFNIKPKISDPNVIILDDAHSSEDYIANLWSLGVIRNKRKNLYMDILQLLKKQIEPSFYDNMVDDRNFASLLNDVDMIPLPKYSMYLTALRDLVDSKLNHGEDEWFSWSMIRNHLHACNLYISWGEISIRPIMPPTMTHSPFANAKQRIYMSATLGEGGELERITGVRRIERLPIPDGWDKQSSGRRLFLFPNLSLDEGEIEELCTSAIMQSNRALILTPKITDVQRLKDRLTSNGVLAMTSQDIELSLNSFTSQDKAALILANRYDGIDLPGDSCRLLIMEGLPAGTNLQERFFMYRLAATSLLRDRLRTRFTQGVGRCCRDATDFATVLVIGQLLFDFCGKSDFRASMHPELQAEIEFGIENSQNAKLSDMLEMMQLLQNQTNDWVEADQAIVQRRLEIDKTQDPVANTLMETVSSEVDFLYEFWKQDFATALEKAIFVSDKLSGNETISYRGWWYYLAGLAAWLGGTKFNDNAMKDRAKDLFSRAAKCSKTISWFAELSRGDIASTALSPADVETVRACESIYTIIQDLGFSGPRFDKFINQFINNIEQNESSQFERGLEDFGKLLGFQASKPNGDGTPDSVWRLSDHLAIAFEAKSKESPDDPVSLTTVRQAQTHGKWIQDNYSIATDARFVTVVVTPRNKISQEAQRNAKGLHHVYIGELRAIAREVAAIMRRIRAQCGGLDQSKAIEVIYSELSPMHLLPAEFLISLTKKPLESLVIA